MNLEEIIANKELFILKKKSEIQKSDFSNFVDELEKKAISSSNEQTEVLVYESTISKSRNEFMFNQYKNGYVLNHSTGMRYVKIAFCYKTDNPTFSEENKNYEKYYPMVINKKDVDTKGYFTAILEAKSIEGSAVVKGSNGLTPVLEMQIIDDETIKVKLAVSPSRIMDSHGDVHIDGLWKKTINENNYDLLLQEHDMDFDKVIADSINEDLKVYTEMFTVKELLSRFKRVRNKEYEPDTSTQKQEPAYATQSKSFSSNQFKF